MVFMKIAVAGTGYVGLVAGVAFAEIGHNVICVDVNQEKIKALQIGVCPIYEEGLQELMIKNKKRLTYTCDYSTAYREADVIFVGVGTPENKDGSANLSYVIDVVDNIIDSIYKDTVVVIKSTVPVGTNDYIAAYFNEKLSGRCRVAVVSNPEFLAQGNAVKDTLFAPRIVVGVEDEWAEKIIDRLYSPLTKEPYNQCLLKMDRASAEMVKYASNDFLALKISYVNEIANLCEALGANIVDVTKGMGMDPRIGKRFLQAGIGYGGSCFPKDTKALYWLSKQVDCEVSLIREAIKVNENQKTKLISIMLKDFNNDINGKNIAVLGATFKPNTDDLREAPSIENVNMLLSLGANVYVYDPVGLENFQNIFNDEITYVDNLEECIKNKDICLIMTEWNEIKTLEPQRYIELMKTPIIYDGRNCYDLSIISQYKLDYTSVGRKRVMKKNEEFSKA